MIRKRRHANAATDLKTVINRTCGRRGGDHIGDSWRAHGWMMGAHAWMIGAHARFVDLIQPCRSTPG
eukprot:1550894-Pyramimonas_sp.AAC.1